LAKDCLIDEGAVTGQDEDSLAFGRAQAGLHGRKHAVFVVWVVDKVKCGIESMEGFDWSLEVTGDNDDALAEGEQAAKRTLKQRLAMQIHGKLVMGTHPAGLTGCQEQSFDAHPLGLLSQKQVLY